MVYRDDQSYNPVEPWVPLPQTGGPTPGGSSGAGGASSSNQNASASGSSNTTPNPYSVPRPELPGRPNMPNRPNVQEDPRMTAILKLLNQYGSGEGARAGGIDQYLMQLFGGDVLGAKQFGGGKSFDPNNPASFALLAPQMQAIAANKDAALRALQESGLSGGELDAAKAAAITGAYGQGAAARQGLVGNALNFLQGRGQEGRANQMGASNALMNYYAQKYGQDLGAETSMYNTDVGANTSMYGTDVGALTNMYGTDVGAASNRYGTDKNFELGLSNQALERERLRMQQEQFNQQMKMQQQQQKKSFLGGLFGTLGGLAGTLIGGPAGGFLGGKLGGSLGGLFSKKPSYTLSAGPQGGTQMNTGGFAMNFPK